MVRDVIILAAGRGTRLKPITDDKPKCMVEINGKPILRHIYDDIHKVIPNPNIIVVINYKLDSYIKIRKEGTPVLHYVVQDILNGTANAVRLAANTLEGNFIVLSGDTIYKEEDIEKLSEEPNSILYTFKHNRLYEYGTIDISYSKIDSISEKSSEPKGNFVNCGAYHFTQDILDYIDKTPIDDRFGEKILTNTINMMVKDGIEFRGVFIDKLNDVTYPEDIKTVEDRL